MIILPPELKPFSRQRYLQDLAYREEEDRDIFAERRERLKILFAQHLQ